jgi:hypothetical protein
MTAKKYVFNDFYYRTNKVDFSKVGTVKKSDIPDIIAKNRMQDKVYCAIKYDVAGYTAMMFKIYSRFYVKQSDTNDYCVYEGKSVFSLDNEYPSANGDFHSNNGTIWSLWITLAELTLQHLSKHVGYVYSESQNTILIEIPSLYGIYCTLYKVFKEGNKKVDWVVLEDRFLEWVELVEQLNEDECNEEFELLKQSEE